MQSGAVDVAQFARHAGRRSVLVANVAWAGYARETAMWDEVMAISPTRLMRNPIYRLRLLMQIRLLGAELLIQPRAARVFLQEDAIARMSGAVRRIGNAGTSINITPRLRKRGDR